MVQRTVTQRPRGNGSVGRLAHYDAPIGAGSVDHTEALAPAHGDASLIQRLHRLTVDLVESRERCEQVTAASQKAIRRVQQLIGERDRLTSLLAERDAELQRLNRELGALTRPTVTAGTTTAALPAVARALLERLRPYRKAAARASSTDIEPSRSNDAGSKSGQQLPTERPLTPWVKSGAPKAVFGVAVLGLPTAEIESVLQTVERYGADRNLAPLLLTDNDAFQLFRRRRVLFEFLPPRSEQERHAPELNWQLFTLRRLALIRRKWQPVRVVAFGRTATEVLRMWLDSPFEATPVPAALRSETGETDMAWRPSGQMEATLP